MTRCWPAPAPRAAREDGAEAIAVLPRRLDQHGLELAVLDAHGVRRLHLPFPGGPVHTLADVPADFPVPLTCACLA